MGVDPHLFQADADAQAGSHSYRNQPLPPTAPQPSADVQYPYTPSSSLQDWEYHPGPHIPNYVLHSSVVSFDTLQVAPGSIIGAHMEEQQDVTVIGLDKLWQSYHNVLDPDPRQAESFTRQQVRLADGCLQPQLHGGTYYSQSPVPPGGLV